MSANNSSSHKRKDGFSHEIKKIISIMISIAMLLLLFPASMCVSAMETVNYLYYNESGDVLTGSTDSYKPVVTATNATWVDNWFVVDGEEVTISNTVKISGTVRLILKDGAVLNANGGIQVAIGSSLTIYAQSAPSEKQTGVLNTVGADYCAGIGGTENEDCGTVIIHGGKIDATGGYNAAGIGGGSGAKGGKVTIYGGDVTARGNEYAAGIGGSISKGNDSFVIYGGKVTAYGGENCAGIGGGNSGNAGSIQLNGGTVYAYGGENGAGIGNGKNSSGGGSITIKKASLYAEGKNGVNAIVASNVTVVPDKGLSTIKVQSSDGTPIKGSPFNASTNIAGFINGITNIQITTHTHSFTGKYKDNGDGTHSRQCNGCDVYDDPEPHEYHDGKCVCSVSIPSYRYYDKTKKEFVTDYISDYKIVTSEDTILTSGWYIADGTCELKSGIVLDGDVNLILKDKCCLKTTKIAPKEYSKEEKASGKHTTLTIYAQSDALSNKNTGKLEVTDDRINVYNHLIIHGGNINAMDGIALFYDATLEIYGGKILATNKFNAGIFCPEDTEITIAGGEVTAGSTGYSDGAGIGGNRESDVGTITITGGKVTAYSEQGGAGIGSCDNYKFVTQASIGKITITGGEVLAYSCGEGAGIGGGYGDDGTEVLITGGKVTAYSKGNGAGIGGGRDGKFYEGKGGDVTITGGEVTAYSCGDGAGIGGGMGGNLGNIKIYGGEVKATGGGGGAGIGTGVFGSVGGNVEIFGGEVTATGATSAQGIGHGNNGGNIGSVAIYGGKITANGVTGESGIGGDTVIIGSNMEVYNSEDTLIILPDGGSWCDLLGRINSVKVEERNSLVLDITDNTFNVMPRGKNAGTGVVIVAMYDSEKMNRLVEVKLFDLSEKQIPFGTFDGGSFIKAMWWSDLSSMTPLCEAKCYPPVEAAPTPTPTPTPGGDDSGYTSDDYGGGDSGGGISDFSGGGSGGQSTMPDSLPTPIGARLVYDSSNKPIGVDMIEGVTLKEDGTINSTNINFANDKNLAKAVAATNEILEKECGFKKHLCLAVFNKVDTRYLIKIKLDPTYRNKKAYIFHYDKNGDLVNAAPELKYITKILSSQNFVDDILSMNIEPFETVIIGFGTK